VTRLEQLARDRLAEAWEAALTEALGDDPTVYVFRRIEAGMLLNVNPNQTDSALARVWGERLAGSVVRGVAGVTEEGNGDNLVTFASQAEFVASFVVDLLQRRAFDRWYYGAFASYESLGKAGALRAVLLDNLSDLPAILREVRERGAFDDLLEALDAATLALLWTSLGTTSDERIESLRPLYAAATDLLDRLDLWASSRPGDNALAAWIGNAQISVDWRDTQSLTRVVCEIIAFLVARGDVRRVEGEGLERVSTRLNDALSAFDWLDTGWLRNILPEMLAGPAAIATDLPLRRGRTGPTPKQRELLADIAAVLRNDRTGLDATDPGSPENRLRLHTALVARASRWQGDPAAASTIELLLAVWAGMLDAHIPSEVIDKLRRHDVAGALALLPGDQRANAAQRFATVADLGDTALEVVDVLLAGGDTTPSTGDWIDTQAAGLFLLLRAIVDARLAGLGNQIGVTSDATDWFNALLVAIGLRWSGSDLDDDVIDAGLSLLAGYEVPPTRTDIADWWAAVESASHLRIQAALLDLLAGQWLARGTTLHLHPIEIDGTLALVAGCETSGLWPLGQIIATSDDTDDTLSRWSDLWQQATGERPSMVVRDGAVALPDNDVGFVGVPESADSDEDALAASHAANGRALDATLDALGHGRLGIADVDLSLFLVANGVLRIWARWLGPFATSSTPYLLEQFIRRPGRLRIDDHSIVVEMEPRPLDVVLEMAGYLAEIEQVPRLNNRRVEFRIGGGE
jgi:hypothetical protein